MIVQFDEIPISETFPGRVKVIGSIKEIELIEIEENPEGSNLRWWIWVKFGDLCHRCLVFNDKGRRFISVNLTANPHNRKEFYLPIR